MTLSITHAKVSAVVDNATASADGAVLPSDWNAAHTLTGTVSNAQLDSMTAGTIKGRSGSTGSPQDLVASDVLTILGLSTSSTDNAIVRFNGTTGGTQNSGVTIDDSNNIVAPAGLTVGSSAKTVIDSAGNISTLHADLTGTGTGSSPPWYFAVSESYSPGTSTFVDPFVVQDTMTGGNGSRQALTANLFVNSGVGVSGENYVGFQCAAQNLGGTGNGHYFGSGAYVLISAGSNSGTEAVAAEFNTDIRASVTRKVGIQVVDVATSTASGSSYDAGILVNSQAGGVGFNYGLQIESAGLKSGSNTAIRVPNNTGLYARNAAGNADINLINIGSGNAINIGNGGLAGIFAYDNFSPSSTKTYALGSSGAVWSALHTQQSNLYGSTSGSTLLQASATASGTLTLPAATDTLVGKATTDTLTNKTLTSPVISGGTIDNAAIGATTATTGKFTTVNATSAIQFSGTQVVGARDTGWTAMTGTPDKASTFATGSVTLVQLAERVMSIQAALTTHGLLGA